MKKNNFILFWIAVSVLFSCQRESGSSYTDTKDKKEDFTLVINVKDGTRSLKKVYTFPEITFLIETSNDEHAYTIEYSIDDGKKQTVSPVLANTSFNIDYEFFSNTDYGPHIVKGSVYDNNNPSSKESFEKIVWVKYLPATTSDPYFVTHLGNKIQETLVVPTNNDGLLCFDYKPEKTVVPCVAESSDESIIKFDSEGVICENGTWKIPYHTFSKEGSAIIKLLLENGDEKSEVTCGVSTSFEKEEGDISAEINVQPFVIEGHNPHVTLKVTSGPDDCTYSADYYIDDILVKKSSAFNLYAEVVDSLEPVLNGEHEIKVVINCSKGYKNTVTFSSLFIVSTVSVAIRDASDGSTLVNPKFGETSSASLYADRDYRVELPGVPVEYLSLFKLENGTNEINKATRNANGWLVSITDVGESTLAVSMIDEPDTKSVINITQYERISLTISKAESSYQGVKWNILANESHSKRVTDLGILLRMEYYGEARVPITDPQTGTYEGETKYTLPSRIIDENKYLLKNEQNLPISLIDISEDVANITSKYEDYRCYSDEGRGFIEWFDEKAYYELIFKYFYIDIYQKKQHGTEDFSKYHIVTVNQVNGLTITIHQSTISN